MQGGKFKCLACNLSPSVAKELMRKAEGVSLSKFKKMIAYVKEHLNLDKQNLYSVLDEAKEAAH